MKIFKELAPIIVIILVVCIVISGVIWMTMGRSGIERFKKNWESKWENGIKREIIIYNSVGEEIFQLEGKFDFTYDSSCIEYIDSETNLKHNVFAGDNTTVIINELNK